MAQNPWELFQPQSETQSKGGTNPWEQFKPTDFSQIDYSIPTDETFIPQPSKLEQPRTIGQKIVGGLETGATIASSVPAYITGAIEGVGKEITTGQFGKGIAEEQLQKALEKRTYTPRTEAGREYTEKLGEFIQKTGIEGLAPEMVPSRVIPKLRGRPLEKVSDVPTVEQLKTQSTNLYQQAKEAGIEFKTQNFNNAMTDIGKSLREEGYTPKAFPKLSAALEESITQTDIPRDFTELQALRNMFNSAKASTDPAERRLASIALDKFDEYVMKAPTEDIKIGDPKAVNLWKDARDTYRRLKKSEVFEDMLATAELDKTRLSQSGLENALTQQLRNLAKNKNKMRLFTPEEQQAIIQASKGSVTQNTLRFLGKFAPTGFFTTFGAGIATAMAPGVGIPLAGLATGARYGATKMRTKGIQNLSEMMRQPTKFGVRINQDVPTFSQYYMPGGLLAEQMQE